MIDTFDIYSEQMDYETINKDFDDIDLFGERMIEDDTLCDVMFE